MIRLGVNIDHVATVRNARGERYPDPVEAALHAKLGGASNITFHLREDRRHVKDHDVAALKDIIDIPLNFEMAATDEMVQIALKTKPQAVTLVPERRAELTTEGGLNVSTQFDLLRAQTKKLKDAGILVSLFVYFDRESVECSKKIGADALEFHTGEFCRQFFLTPSTAERFKLLTPIKKAASLAKDLGLQVHFGHGLNYQNANWLQLIPEAEEANIGHAIVARALFVGMTSAVSQMKVLLNDPANRPI